MRLLENAIAALVEVKDYLEKPEGRMAYMMTGLPNEYKEKLKGAIMRIEDLDSAIQDRPDFNRALTYLKETAGLRKMGTFDFPRTIDEVHSDISTVITRLNIEKEKSISKMMESKYGIQVSSRTEPQRKAIAKTKQKLIFICYPRERLKLAKKVKYYIEQISDAQIHAFVAKRDATPGMPFTPEIKNALRDATHMIVLATPEFIGKAYANQEVGAFLIQEKPIHVIPMGGDPDKLGYLKEIHSIIEVDKTEEDELAEQIAKEVALVANKTDF